MNDRKISAPQPEAPSASEVLARISEQMNADLSLATPSPLHGSPPRAIDRPVRTLEQANRDKTATQHALLERQIDTIRATAMERTRPDRSARRLATVATALMFFMILTGTLALVGYSQPAAGTLERAKSPERLKP